MLRNAARRIAEVCGYALRRKGRARDTLMDHVPTLIRELGIGLVLDFGAKGQWEGVGSSVVPVPTVDGVLADTGESRGFLEMDAQGRIST